HTRLHAIGDEKQNIGTLRSCILHLSLQIIRLLKTSVNSF
ncbi:MAG: hypothetical protein ACI8V2_004145, partial [Candidatus Latescibacterota bacterium]